MNRTMLDFWVGLFVLIGALALMFLALQAGSVRIGGSDAYTLTARFDNIGGLKVKAPVKSAGVVVGRVSDIRFNTEVFRADVTLTIDSRFEFPRDTIASILTSGLLGEQYVGLDAGGDPDNFVSGDRIEMTQSAVVLEMLISQFLFTTAAAEPAQDAQP